MSVAKSAGLQLFAPCSCSVPGTIRLCSQQTTEICHKKTFLSLTGSIADLCRAAFRVNGSGVRVPQNKIYTCWRQLKYSLSPCCNIVFPCCCPGFSSVKNCFDILVIKAAWEERKLFISVQGYGHWNRNEWPENEPLSFTFPNEDAMINCWTMTFDPQR